MRLQIYVGLIMIKNEYRRIYKEKRLNLSVAERLNMDEQICVNLQSFNWNNVSYVHVYLPLKKFNEPDTLGFVSYLRMNYPEIKLVVSKSILENSIMENYIWDENTVLVENRWGILEPSNGLLVDAQHISVVIVPLLVADKKGNRVGYGKGFYDRFLSKCQSEVRKIGVSYFEPVDQIDDVGEWDVPIDVLVTGNGVYSFVG